MAWSRAWHVIVPLRRTAFRRTDRAGRKLLSCPECGETFPEAFLRQIYIERRNTPSIAYLRALLASPVVLVVAMLATKLAGYPDLGYAALLYPFVVSYLMARKALSRHGPGFGTGMAFLLGPLIALLVVGAELLLLGITLDAF